MNKLFDLINNTDITSWDVIVSRLGEDTPFEAVSRVEWDADSGLWGGFLVFKDERFSPSEPEMPEMQFQYITPFAAGGVLADRRAELMWETLCGIFETLTKNTGADREVQH